MPGSMAIIQKLWKTSPTAMLLIVQTTNLMTILGMAVGPQIARPFLGRELDHIPVNATTSTTPAAHREGLHPVQVQNIFS